MRARARDVIGRLRLRTRCTGEHEEDERESAQTGHRSRDFTTEPARFVRRWQRRAPPDCLARARSVFGVVVANIGRAAIAQDGTLVAFMITATSTQIADGDVVPLGNFVYVPGGYDGAAPSARVLRAEVR